MHNKAITDSGLYRGVTRPIEEIQLVPIRTDRLPRNSSAAQSRLFDVCFQELYGAENIRRRALFCTTDFDVAAEYSHGFDGQGSIVEVMPLKSSKMAYHTAIPDSMTICEQFENHFARTSEDAQYIVNLLDESPGESSMAAFNQALSQIDEGKRATVVADLKAVGNELLRGYVVGAAHSLSGKSGNFEVMIFDAPNYYASPVQDEGFGGDFYD